MIMMSHCCCIVTHAPEVCLQKLMSMLANFNGHNRCCQKQRSLISAVSACGPKYTRDTEQQRQTCACMKLTQNNQL